MNALRLYVWHALISSWPSYHLRRWYVVNVLNNRCDLAVALHRHLKFFSIGGISIGAQTTINRDVTLDGRGQLEIGRCVSISEGVKVLTAGHAVNAPDFHCIEAPVNIKDWVWIGANALILPGVTIHEGAIIGAGSVVTRDVPAWTVAAGNPARALRSREVKPEYSPLWKPRLF